MRTEVAKSFYKGDAPPTTQPTSMHYRMETALMLQGSYDLTGPPSVLEMVIIQYIYLK